MFRRYRIFLLFSVLFLIGVYHFRAQESWFVPVQTSSPVDSVVVKITKPAPVPATTESLRKPATVKSASASVSRIAISTTKVPWPASTITGEELLRGDEYSSGDFFGEKGEGRKEVVLPDGSQSRAHWTKQVEKFPVRKDEMHRLPAKSSLSLDKIQYNFAREGATSKADRKRKQATVREVFKHAWKGYKEHAYGHDEVRPVSGKHADPFNGWGATLVDSLDTLWIMDLKEDFEVAVAMVGEIDFTTSARKDIPLFETTIRYLGGLLSAYDISGAKHKVLLEKAVELAEVLMGAFDTPNRMPVTFYNWAPSYASQPHRAGTHVVLAELGSLSLEFTRLAQLTNKPKYYDAIARITDALHSWQMNTTYPGLWPFVVDASGCKKASPRSERHGDGNEDENPSGGMMQTYPFGTHDDLDPTNTIGMGKRQVDHVPETSNNAGFSPQLKSDASGVGCVPQGLNIEPNSEMQGYGIGGRADSTYEYLPKEYLLLGASNEQYREMYEKAMEVIRKDLLFRPMIQDEERDILFAARHEVYPDADGSKPTRKTHWEGTHLSCFAGGMLALGAKVFDIPGDLKLAKKLTDGCVWAYESMPVGVMAEEFTLVPCERGDSCPWNEAKWFESLDPNHDARIEAVEMSNRQAKLLLEQNQSEEDAIEEANSKPKSPAKDAVKEDFDSLDKRQVDDDASYDIAKTERKHPALSDGDKDSEKSSRPIFIPKVALSHKKFVQTRIAEERLPPGYTRIKSRDYRLRPEAIESVFIMYRITGDEAWREKGWAMFQSIVSSTRTALGHASVKDVSSLLLELDDTMESFWLAETLKYFYLLYSEPDLISLDDYVLNTEAHPFKLSR